MSRSRRDQRGKRINRELGRDQKIVGDRIIKDYGWEPMGSPASKAKSKHTARRMQRRIDKTLCTQEDDT